MTDIEKVKVYLNQIRERDRMIDKKCKQLAELRAKSTCIRSQDYSSDRVQSSSSGDAMPRMIARIIDLQEEINADIDRFVDLKEEIRKSVEALPAKQAAVIYAKYFEYKSISQIAEETSHDRRTIQKLHRRALLNLSKTQDVEIIINTNTIS